MLALNTLEPLEARRLLSGNVLQTNLVSDLPGVAAVQDPNLVNPWGISEGPTTPFWVSDNGSGLATLYNTAGTPQSRVVAIPGPSDPLNASGTPTGTVFNTDSGAGGFKVNGVNASSQSASASAIFLFATEDGTIVGWNPGVNPTGFNPTNAGNYGIIAKDHSSDGAVYKGMTIASSANPIFASDAASTTVLYVTNFHSGQIEAYDPNFNQIALPAGAFSDPHLHKGYAPFNIELINNKLYVTYAKQDAEAHDDVAGKGHGFVDVFNLDGSPGFADGSVRLISRGALDSPWGMAIAPPSFGSLAGDLLVGNFGDGTINVFNSTTGKSLGHLKDPDGEAIQIDGLWALQVGNGSAGGDADDVYFTAGLFGESHGLFGSLAPVAAGTPEGDAEAQIARAHLDVAQLALTTFQTDLASNAPRSQLRDDRKALDDSLDDLNQIDHDLAKDRRDDGGQSTLEAQVDSEIDAFIITIRKFDRSLDR